jgi:AraC-like DNA-binding protein
VRTIAFGLSLAGIAPGPILEAAGVSPGLLFDNDARIPAERITALWEAGESFCESFGLRCSLAITPLRDVLLGYLVRASPTLGDALALLLRYQKLLQDFSETTVVAGETTTLILQQDTTPTLTISRAAVEWAFASSLRFASESLGRKVLPERVTFRHGPPKDLSLHDDAFGTNIAFGAERNSFTLDNHIFREPLKTADVELVKILDQRAAEVLRLEPAEDEFVNALRAAIERLLREGEATLPAAAKAMAMSSRSLQRRLAEGGLSFRDVVDSLRSSLARAHIQDASLSLAQVAFLLGFADQSSFHRAFVRWNGQSPGTARLEIARR